MSEPNCTYKDLTFIPFEPKLVLGSLLAWQDQQKFSKASEAFLEYIRRYKRTKE